MSNPPSIFDLQARHPHAYYSIDVDEPTARLATELRRQEYRMWQALLPAADDDYAVAVASIRRLTAKGERQIESALSAHFRIRELPCLLELQELTARLDQTRLIAIDDGLSKTDDAEVIAEIDRRLTAYLIPRHANQHLPTASQIRRRINDYLRVLAPNIDVDAEPDCSPPRMDIRHGDDGRSFIDLDLATDVALEVEAIIRARIREKNLDPGEALLDLLRGTSETGVCLNVYRASDVADAPAFVFGAGWMWHAGPLIDRADTIRDMDAVAAKVSGAYQTPEDIRAYVVGRDGICRAPGHAKRADHCQMDHTVDFADGGLTTPANLASLCATDHNIKTDGRAIPIQLPDGIIVWLYDNGTWVLTEPEGPLSAKARNWVQTVGQRIANRRKGKKAPDKF